MAKLLDSVKALGEKITGEKINGDTLFDAVKDAGEKMTGKEIEGKELNDVIAETAKEYQGGGGTVVVDELPETGEANTIYELHEQVEPAYNWVAEIDDIIDHGGFNPVQDDGYLLVLETYEDMLAKVNENVYDGNQSVYIYLRTEDRLFEYWLNKDAGEHMYREWNKVSDYTFSLKEGTLYVLKSIRVDFGTPEHPLEDPMYWGTLYNGTEFLLDQYSGNDKAFILRQATFDAMNEFIATGYNVYQVSALPTAEEAVENYLNELITTDGFIAVGIDGVVKSNSNDNEIYHWGWKKAHPEPIYNFWQYVEGADEPVYTGPLEWRDISLPVYSEIPYQDIFDGDLEDWIFKPEQGGEKVSYWIYANNTWTNTEDIGKPVKQEVIYGELLKGATFDTDAKLISPYTNEQICNYVAEGKPVILRYHSEYMGENQFMYVYINGYEASEMADEYVNQYLYYENFTCSRYNTTDTIEYNFGSDYFYYSWGE